MTNLQVDDVETPALLIDLEVLESNIATMKEKMKGKKCGYRPHVKAHKSPFIAQKQLASGALGVTCQTIEEAEAMMLSGVQEILLTNPAVTESKIGRTLAIGANSSVAVTVDNAENVKALASAAERKGRVLDVVVEVNVGQNRTGVAPGKPALELIRVVEGLRSLRF